MIPRRVMTTGARFLSAILKGDRIYDFFTMRSLFVFQRVIFSQDQDFLPEAKRRQVEGINFPGVVYARQSRVTTGDCVRDLEIIAKVGNPEDFANRVQYLPL